jgi:hypothetical protein
MTIEQYADFADVLAGIATVVALVFLTIQIRSATAQMKADSRRNEVAQPYISSIVENSDVARVFLAGLTNSSVLSAEDSTRFAFLMGQYIGAEAAYFDEVRFGVGTTERLDQRKPQLTQFLSTPGGRAWWVQYKHSFPGEFISYAENTLGDSGAT